MKENNLKKAVKHYHQSSSFKMATFFTILLGFSVAIAGYLFYTANQKNFIRETKASIESEIHNIVDWYNYGGQKLLISTLKEKQKGNPQFLYLLIGADDKEILSNLEIDKNKIEKISEGILTFEYNSEKYAAGIHTWPNNQKLLVARSIQEITSAYEKLEMLSLVSIILMVIVVLVSFFISHFVVKYINQIAINAKEIIDTADLSRRIEVDNNWDDLSKLAQVLNEMLGRIEFLMQNVRQASSNIAHDLRTPLSRLKANIDTLKEETKDQVMKSGFEKLTTELDGLINIFNALLRISTIEARKSIEAFSLFSFDELIKDAIEFYEPLMEKKSQNLDFELEKIEYFGDKDLLFQMLINLLDNACKFTPQKGEIKISLKKENQKIILLLSDSGCGIDENCKKKVFDRFYRSEHSRNSRGNGLGLSLVLAIINLHKGSIELLNNQPKGLIVKIIL